MKVSDWIACKYNLLTPGQEPAGQLIYLRKEREGPYVTGQSGKKELNDKEKAGRNAPSERSRR